MRGVARASIVVGGLGAVYCGLVRCWRSRCIATAVAPAVVDEGVIDAPPDVVYRAVVDEHDGKTSWWAPHYSMQLLSGDTYSEVGAILDNTVRLHGRFPIRFVTRTVAVEPNKSIIVDYIDGAFRGEATWSFERTDNKTRLRLSWRTQPSGALGVLAPFLPIEKSHSDTTKVGFENLNAFLSRVQSGADAGELCSPGDVDS